MQSIYLFILRYNFSFVKFAGIIIYGYASVVPTILYFCLNCLALISI